VIALHGLSVATSGDYRRYFNADAARFSHTIDPRTGYPIQHGLASVTVIHRDCMVADAVSTALNVMGVEQGMAFAQTHDIAARFVQRTESGYSEHLSPAFTKLLE
jgi:thiamine biosynthesis lipoprotein